MKIKTKPLKKDSGQVIMFVIFVILFLVMFVSLFISKSLLRQTKVSSGVVSSVQAYYIADTGTENVLYYLDSRDPALPPPPVGPITLDSLFSAQGGVATAYISEVTVASLKVDIVGTYKNTSRAIQLFW